MRKTILATGADIKNRFLISDGKSVHFGPEISDLSDVRNYELFKKEIKKAIKKNKPDIITCDLHPGYFSSKLAKEYSSKMSYKSFKPVQHHHAHIASIIYEHDLKGPVIGVSFDGTGFGTDGNIWGGEFLLVKGPKFKRLGHLKYVKMPGGDKVVYEPWRMALSILGKKGAYLLKKIKKEDKDLVISMLDKDINSPLTSSCGRLFDAAAALLGICLYSSREAEGPIKLESICKRDLEESYKFKIEKYDDHYEVDTKSIFLAMAGDIKKGKEKSVIAAKFHNSMTNVIVETVKKLSKECGVKDIALSGGGFQNNFLREKVIKELRKARFKVFLNKANPVNDLNIAWGQYYVSGSSR